MSREAMEKALEALMSAEIFPAIQALRAALAEADPWKTAVLDALVVNWTLTAEHENDPRKAVADLIASEVRIALDPLVSSDAQALIDRGKAESSGAEPVAWQERTYSEEDKDWSNWYHIDNETLSIRQRYPRSYVELRPLYTHPPAREAELSDEEIIALMPPRLREWHDYGPIQRATLMDFARALLAARGNG